MVLRDHLAESTFHYLPGPPRVVVDGQRPQLSLMRYRGAHSGGLLTLEVDTSIEDSMFERVRGELGGRTSGGVNLVPVLFQSGTVRLIALGIDEATLQPDSSAPDAPPS